MHGDPDPKFYVKIVDTETGNVERRMGPLSERQADKVERGANINLNHERFHTEIEDAAKEDT